MVVLVLVVGHDAEDRLPHHAQHRMPHERGIPQILQGGGELWGQPDPLVKLGNRQQPGIARQGRVGNFDFHGSGSQKIE